ncbi:hypothetical protein [Pseudomonas fluorescens]|uniref:hypothetical protein n=1 Tax=Pseudomonas fluorescens TaxID=294 RepID=UPI001CA65F19|nr:hypothetical protein [Pseudomonas fluorescens]MBY8934244.1 hypothetical protein [Pseudomonas fluorescens]
MSRKDNGGPAFPVADYDHQIFQPKNEAEAKRYLSGMSLRDYFAARCCAAMVSTIRNDGDYMRLRNIAQDHDLDSVSQFFAQEAYKQADAMLAARSA